MNDLLNMSLESHLPVLQYAESESSYSPPHSPNVQPMDVQVDSFPQSSQHMQAMCLQHLALSLDLPTTSSSHELREIIEKKLSSMKHSESHPRNIQVMLQHAFASALLQLMDAYGIILDAESSESGSENEDIAHHDGASDYSTFYSPVLSHTQALDSYRLQIQDLEIERDRLEDTILILREDIERERERNEELQELNDEQNTEIDYLKTKILELKEEQVRTTHHSSKTITPSPNKLDPPAIRKSPRWVDKTIEVDKKSDTSQPSTSSAPPPPSSSSPNSKLRGKTCVAKSVMVVRPTTRIMSTRPFLRSRAQHDSNSDKRYECDHCDKVFRERHHLDVHQRQHTGVKPFKCKICRKKFGRSNALSRHIRAVHKPFQ